MLTLPGKVAKTFGRLKRLQMVWTLLVVVLLSSCAKPERVEPLVRQSLAQTLQQTFPHAENVFTLGPFGGEAGIENLVTLDVSTNQGNVHLIARDFLQTQSELQRLSAFLTQKENHDAFLANIAFPHHYPLTDAEPAKILQAACIGETIPALQVSVLEHSKWRSGWLVMLPYTLKDARLQRRTICLLALGDEAAASELLRRLVRLESLTTNRLPFRQDPVGRSLFGTPCR